MGYESNILQGMSLLQEMIVLHLAGLSGSLLVMVPKFIDLGMHSFLVARI